MATNPVKNDFTDASVTEGGFRAALNNLIDWLLENKTKTDLQIMDAINIKNVTNKVINGAQEIDQVNNGAALTPTTSVVLTDMFGCGITQPSKLTFQQVVDAPVGLKNSMRITVASQYAPLSADQFIFRTAIEGKDVIDFSLGTSGAATFTTSLWIKGSVAGTYSISLSNAALNRSYIGTVSVTTSWTQLKITVAGDLTGTWATDATIGLNIALDLGSGGNFNGTAGAWAAGNLTRTSGSVTFVNQTGGSTLNITGVDCRLGNVAPTVFERRANEVQLAQRYREINNYTLSGTNAWTPASAIHFMVGKRVEPTVSEFSVAEVLGMGSPTFNVQTVAFCKVFATATASTNCYRTGSVLINAGLF